MRLAWLFVLAACRPACPPCALANTPAPEPPGWPYPPPPPPATTTPPPIIWTIDCAPSTVSMAQRASVWIFVHATSTVPGTTPTEHELLDFKVDGRSSTELGMAFGNGGYAKEWDALPDDETVTDRRHGLSLVPGPGDHVISISLHDVEVASTTLHVTP
jgi:hypothetical protein